MAAQATVRVQWNGERGPRLSNGLGIPEGHRSHTRHRLRHCTRNGAFQVTRGDRAALSACNTRKKRPGFPGRSSTTIKCRRLSFTVRGALLQCPCSPRLARRRQASVICDCGV